ncbi:MAG: hypothetical protein KAI28_10620 [Sphingomonadales bacterium]|nr:hypothetical protein [Sphingomonadales bacterium]
MAEFDEHEVKRRLEVNRRARKGWRDGDTYLNILIGVAALFGLVTFGFILLALFL